jgi:hypothetical protein
MHFPKFWAWGWYETVDRTGKPAKFGAWGWSDESEDAARAHGAIRAKRSFDFLQAHPHSPPSPPDPYLYGDGRPFRELVLEEWQDGEAVISRNRVGCDVLNTARMGFVDVDYDQVNLPAAGFLSLFGPKRLSREARAKEVALKSLQEWLHVSSEDSFRIYETAAGLRYLLTSRTVEPESPDTRHMLNALGSDRRYIKLCEAQKCFRARLTPKPWRALSQRGQWDKAWVEPTPPALQGNTYPQEQFQENDPSFARYREYSAGYATCKFVGAVGSGTVLPEFEPLIALHDERTRAHSGLPLA